MFKKIIKVLTITVTIIILGVVCKLINNTKIKKEIQEANEKYIINNEEVWEF